MGKLAIAFVLSVFAGALADDILIIIVNLTAEQAFATVGFQMVCWTFSVLFALLLIARSIQNEPTDQNPETYKRADQ